MVQNMSPVLSDRNELYWMVSTTDRGNDKKKKRTDVCNVASRRQGWMSKRDVKHERDTQNRSMSLHEMSSRSSKLFHKWA